jgi:hypothetical protein
MTQLSQPAGFPTPVAPVVPPGGGSTETPRVASALADVSLDELLNKVRGQIQRTAPVDPKATDKFVPIEPNSFAEAQLSEGQVEGLVAKFLLSTGTATGRQCADQVALPFKLIDEVLAQMKTDQLVVYRGS